MMSKAQDDIDIILNRHSVVQARAQKVVQSWLGPSVEAEALWEANGADDLDFDQDAEGLHLGIGAKAPDAERDLGFGLKRKPLGVNDQLLEQILGKKAAKEHRAKTNSHARVKSNNKARSPSPHANANVPVTASDSDEDDSRASMIKDKRGRDRNLMSTKPVKPRDLSSSDGSSKGNEKASAQQQAKRSRGNTYLDELLAKKSSKKHRT